MGKFVIRKMKKGFKFDLKAGNGEVIATSQTYDTEAACRSGIESVKKICASGTEDQTTDNVSPVKNPKYEVYKDKADAYRFRLKAQNGSIVATSEAYKSKAGCLNGIESVKKNAPEAEAVTETA